MANINLLPWREEYRQEKKREFLGVLGMALLFTIVVAFAWDRVAMAGSMSSRRETSFWKPGLPSLDKQVAEISELKKATTGIA